MSLPHGWRIVFLERDWDWEVTPDDCRLYDGCSSAKKQLKLRLLPFTVSYGSGGDGVMVRTVWYVWIVWYGMVWVDLDWFGYVHVRMSSMQIDEFLKIEKFLGYKMTGCFYGNEYQRNVSSSQILRKQWISVTQWNGNEGTQRITKSYGCWGSGNILSSVCSVRQIVMG